MRFKPFHLYLAGAIVALIVCGGAIIFYYPSLDVTEIVLAALPVLILGYLAFKVYHENDDKELM